MVYPKRISQKKIKADVSTISFWENGKYKANESNKKALSELFGINSEFLYDNPFGKKEEYTVIKKGRQDKINEKMGFIKCDNKVLEKIRSEQDEPHIIINSDNDCSAL